jgi:hypothetical protein
MKNFIISSLFIVLCLAPWACTRPFPVGPVPSAPPTSTPTPTITLASASTRTSTPTVTATTTSACGFTSVIVPTPVTAASAPGTFFYVIRTLADWQSYYGSTSAPAPPATLGSQMILINLQSVPVSQYILPYLPYTGVCAGVTYAYESDLNYPTPSASYNYTVSVQNVCWTSTQMMVSYNQYVDNCNCSPLPIFPIGTPISIPTPVPTATPAPSGSPCNPGQSNTIYLDDAVGVVVPASSVPIFWNQIGTLNNPDYLCGCPA